MKLFKLFAWPKYLSTHWYRFIDLLRQKNTSIPQQINFIGKLEEDDGATIFFIDKKQQKAVLNFSLDSVILME